MEALTPGHLLLILLAVILLFGYKRLPEASRALGRSLRIFKGELHAMPGDGRYPSSPDAAVGDVPAAGGEAEARPPTALSSAVSSPEALDAEAAAEDARAARLRERAAQHDTRALGG